VWLRPQSVRRERRQLGPDEITAAALAIADAEGPDAVSMRRVAARLNSGTMTLYSYVQSKEELLDLMLDAVMAEIVIPGELPDDWRDALREIARRSRAAYLRHPWLVALAGSRPRVGPNAIRHVEQSLAAVAALGLDNAGILGVIAAVDDYAIGHVYREISLEQATGARHGDTQQWREAYGPYIERMLEQGGFPHLERIYRSDFKEMATDPGRFDRGLDWLLAGIAASIEPPAKRRVRRRRDAPPG
jgi:AcrR family transcriptional regulator